MTPEQIILALEHHRGEFPQTELQAALADPEAVASALLEALHDVADNPEAVLRNQPETYFLYLYALYLLAAARDTRAFPSMLRLAAAAPETLEALLGDIVPEDLHNLLASVCGGDTERLRNLAEYPEADEFARSAALHALVTLYVEGEQTRAQLLDYLGRLLATLPEHEGPLWAALLINVVLAIHGHELLPQIQALYHAQRVDTEVLALAEVEHDFADPITEQELLEELREQGYGYLDQQVLELMASWPCFTGEEYDEVSPPQPPVQRSEPKVGRNDPCPCGSGKKYKKCCGAS